jgi:hypothetical protein
MTLAILLLPVVEAFSAPGFDAAAAEAMLGSAVHKSATRWQLAPRNPDVAQIELDFEDLPAGAHLLTTIRVVLRKPAEASLDSLSSEFGATGRWLPATGPHRPQLLAFDYAKGTLPVTAMLSAEYPRDDAKLVIASALVRRFYPDRPR